MRAKGIDQPSVQSQPRLELANGSHPEARTWEIAVVPLFPPPPELPHPLAPHFAWKRDVLDPESTQQALAY